MTENLSATYATIDSLQKRGEYEEIEQIAQYAIDAAVNDEYKIKIRFPKVKK